MKGIYLKTREIGEELYWF